MGKDIDSFLENAMKGVGGIIEEVERLETGGTEMAPIPESIDADTAQKELGALEHRELVSEDGGFEIRITDNVMEVRADFRPPAGEGAPISLEAMEDALLSKGITHGVDWEAVKDGIMRCNGECEVVADVIVARGTPAEDEVPACTVMEPSLLHGPPQGPGAGGAVDYKAQSPFQLVRKGNVLARIFEKREGVLGMNVKGAAVRYGRKIVKNPRLGKNTQVLGNMVLAACDGCFTFSPDSLSIAEVLSIPGDVDYSTGHIDFPGDVMVAGEIKNGFKLKAGGSLFCNRVIDATEVICGGDLITNQGILGRGSGIVKAGGGISARFIENCFVEAKKTISVSTGCLNSLVHTLDIVDAGAKGMIVGGIVVAQNGVSAGQLGAASGTRTEVKCGIDYTVSQKLAWIRDRNIALALKLKEVERLISGGREGEDKLAVFREKLNAAIHKLTEAARVLVMGLDKNESAEIVVYSTVHPGTCIEICNIPYTVERPQAHVVFSLDKKSGKVVCQKLTGTR
jgi:hypothetical protein